MITPVDRLIDLFNEAKALPAGASRDEFVGLSCGEDDALRKRLARLLAADESAGDFLTPTPLVRDSAAITEGPGDFIGRYKLMEKIGEGGCGVVYLAEQAQPVRRRVALKIIKLGMDTRQVVARFEAERQALALMDHPNIAKVFDGGATETGRPYFVMEAVRGIKITAFCDQNRLSTEERLNLFIQVCQAIQHAHQKGIIHRDIKPSNILVTVNDGVPVPKVIDFGIAKATEQSLTDKTVYTAFEQFMGTPAYMSPEQAEMTSVDIDTRSDIYALGILLYELLTGGPPYDAERFAVAGVSEIRRVILERDPANPSARLNSLTREELTTLAIRRASDAPKLVHRIRGDLDWIVMKCLEKDRARRYETANGLAADVQRHLTQEPVEARPPSGIYRFQKLVRRNKVGFVAAASVAAALVLGIIASAVQTMRAIRAEAEQRMLRTQAESNEKAAATAARKSAHVAQFMREMLRGVGPSMALGRDTAMLREILDTTVARMGAELRDEPEVEVELRHTIGVVFRELGEMDKSEAMHREALRLERERLGDVPARVATALYHLGQTLRCQSSKSAEAEAVFRESLSIRRRIFGNEHAAVADVLNRLGSFLSVQLEDAEPEALLRESLDIRRKLYPHEHWEIGESLDNLAHVLRRRGNIDEAAAMHREAFAIRRKVLGPEHPELIYSFQNLAKTLELQGDLPGAVRMLREGASLAEKLLGERHPELPHIRAELDRLQHSASEGNPVELHSIVK